MVRMRVLMIKDNVVIVVFAIGCAVFSTNMVVALMVGRLGHAAQWGFVAVCFGIGAYRVWRRSRNERQNRGESKRRS